MRFGEVVKKIEKLDLMVQTHQYCYEFQYYYELKYCDVVIRVFKEWLKIDNCDNKNQWEFSIDLDKINNFSIDENDNSYLIKKVYDEKHIKDVEFWENRKKETI